jgi:two-component system, LytTR family, response regulator
MTNPEKINRVAFPIRTGYIFSDRSDVLFCRAEGSYTQVHLRNREPLLVSYKLKMIEGLLHGLPFFRTHESWLVNLSHVSELKREDGDILLKINETNAQVARARKKALMEAFDTL